MSYRVQILHGSSYEKCQAVGKLSSSCRQIQKYKNTQNNSPAPAINTQKEKKSKKLKKCKKIKKNAKAQKEKNMQKEQQNIKFYFRASY